MSDKQASLFDNGKDFDKTDVYLVYYYLLGRRPEDEKTLNHALNGYLNREEMVRQVLLSDEFAGKRNSQEFDGKDDDQIYRAFESYRYTKRFEEGDVLQRNVDSALLDDKDAKANKTIRFGDERTTITGACFSNDLNKKIGYLTSGIDAVLLISFEINELAKQYNFGFDIYTMDDVQCFGTDMMLDGFQYTETEEQGQPKRERHVRCLLENMNLAPGEYKFNVYVMDENNIPMDYIENYGTFFVKSDEDTRDAGDARGVIDLKKKWFTEKILEEIRKRRGVSNDD
ncbi:MAG: Wzt carbohydrate-binding domain-containing protein [Christensenellaceae bacterium]